MSNILAIIEGHKNLIFQDEETEIKYQQRILICNPCESRKSDLNIDICGECGCPLATLLRQDVKHCNLGKW